jgi:hypothetical protein
VIEGGVGFADDVDKAQLAAQLRRIVTRIWLLTEFEVKVARPATPERIKKAAWENQKHEDGTVGCYFLEVACTEDIKAACRLICRGRDAHLTWAAVEFAHLWAMWHQLHSGFWDKDACHDGFILCKFCHPLALRRAKQGEQGRRSAYEAEQRDGQ